MLARQFLVVLPWITKIVIFERFIWKNKAMIDNFLDRVQTPNVDNFGKSLNFTKQAQLSWRSALDRFFEIVIFKM